MQELQITPKTMPTVGGNFDKYKDELIKQMEGYKTMPLTEETVAPVKSAIRSIRTTLEKIETTAVSAYFDSPKKALKANFAELYSIIAEGESKVDAVIAEDTRKRNEETTTRLTGYITSRIKDLALEKDVIDHVVLKKSYYNKTAKETEVLNEIDADLAQFEKNFASYLRAEKKIIKLAQECGAAFNKSRFIYALSKYGEGNDSTSALAEEEADRLKNLPPEALAPVTKTCVPTAKAVVGTEEIIVEFPTYDKKTSEGSEEAVYTFTVPKEAKKQFAALLKQLKTVGIIGKKA